MKRKQKTKNKKQKKIDWGKMLPPLTKIPGKTRLAEERDLKELRRRMRDNPPIPRSLKKEI